MSTHKRIDWICVVAILLSVCVTILFMNGERLGIEKIVDEDNELHSDSVYFTTGDLEASWDATGATTITLSDEGTEISGTGAYVNGSDVVIRNAGTYVVSGRLTDGSLTVDAYASSKVWILLDGVDLTCAEDAAFRVDEADKVFLTLAEGTENRLASGSEYSQTALDDGRDGALFARDDLTINGSGSLTVTAAYKHGLVANDDLVITGGTLTVTAPADAVRANDSLRIREAGITVTAGDDGLVVDNDDGWFYMESGTVAVEAADDGVHTGGAMTVTGGEITVQAGDDGLHSDTSVTVSGGTVTIPSCNEGIEAVTVDISGGEILINPTDDGINASGGSADSEPFGGRTGGMRGDPVDAGQFSDRASREPLDPQTGDPAEGQTGSTNVDGRVADGRTNGDGDDQTNGNGQTTGKPSGSRPDGGQAGVRMRGGPDAYSRFGADSETGLPDGDVSGSTDSDDTAFGRGNRNAGNFTADDTNRSSDGTADGGMRRGTDASDADSTTEFPDGSGAGNTVWDPMNGIADTTDKNQDKMEENGGNAGTQESGDSEDEDSVNPSIRISGGTITIINETGRDADGLDSNGDIIISGGTILISLVGSGGNCAIDYASENGGTAAINGGTVIACGDSSMMESISDTSTQPSIMYNVSSALEAGSTIRLTDSEGTELLSWTPPCSCSSVLLSSPALTVGGTYVLTTGSQSETITLDTTVSSFGESAVGMGNGMGGTMGMRKGGRIWQETGDSRTDSASAAQSSGTDNTGTGDQSGAEENGTGFIPPNGGSPGFAPATQVSENTGIDVGESTDPGNPDTSSENPQFPDGRDGGGLPEDGAFRPEEPESIASSTEGTENDSLMETSSATFEDFLTELPILGLCAAVLLAGILFARFYRRRR